MEIDPNKCNGNCFCNCNKRDREVDLIFGVAIKREGGDGIIEVRTLKSRVINGFSFDEFWVDDAG